MKVKARLLAVALAAAVGLAGMTACSSDTWIAKENGAEIPISEYLYNAYSVYNYYNVNIPNYYGMDFKSYMKTYPSSVESIDDSIYKAFETFHVTNTQFDKLKLSLTDEQKEAWENDYKEYVQSLGSRAKLSKYMKLMRISDEATLKEYFSNQYKLEAIKEYYFGENGKEKKDEAKLKEKFSADYVRVKHILFKIETTDENGEDLSDEEKAEKENEVKKKAEDLLAEIKAGKKDFDELSANEDVNEDPGSIQNKDGYVVNVKDYTELMSGSTFDTAFVDAAKELKNIGDTTIVKGSHGYHIIKKYDLYEEDTDFFETYKTNEINAALQAKIDAWVEEAKLDYNAAALNKYSVNKLKTLSD